MVLCDEFFVLSNPCPSRPQLVFSCHSHRCSVDIDCGDSGSLFRRCEVMLPEREGTGFKTTLFIDKSRQALFADTGRME